MNTDTNTEPSPEPTTKNTRQRRRLLTILVLLIVLAAIGIGVYYLVYARWHESTEDAYASGNIIEITPQIAGTIVEIGAEDNTLVNLGDVLVRLDQSDAEIALEEAEAKLARTVRQVRGLYANVNAQLADLSVKQTALERAKSDLERRTGLEKTGAISQEEFAHAQAEVKAADRALSISKDQLKVIRALIDDTTVATHPDVRSAATAVRKASLNLARSTLVAPVSGYVTQRNAQVGQRVAAGLPLLALVPLDQLWIDANFKETQLEHMRIGQPVKVTSDLYGSNVVFHGKVASLGIGTGSAMSILPAQNATGNWIKIVQRIPVRIALDPEDLQKHPLRIGLSMRVTVDMTDRSGPVLTESDTSQPTYSTSIHLDQLDAAEQRINEIIRKHSGSELMMSHP